MKTVLFVCVHNAGRSKMAEAFFNTLAKGEAKATSAGTQPGKQVNLVVFEAMKEVGIDISQSLPQILTLEMMEQADRVITMGCGADASCPATLVPTEDWGLDDAAGKPLVEVRKLRDEIKQRIIKLLGELDSSGD